MAYVQGIGGESRVVLQNAREELGKSVRHGQNGNAGTRQEVEGCIVALLHAVRSMTELSRTGYVRG